VILAAAFVLLVNPGSAAQQLALLRHPIQRRNQIARVEVEHGFLVIGSIHGLACGRLGTEG
jgi:hypothetical protein